MATISEILAPYKQYEWYDNSRLNSIMKCKRYGYYHLLGPRNVPLATKVGAGADIGSCFHNAHAVYYGSLSREGRLLRALRKFHSTYAELLSHYTELPTKHSLVRVLDIADQYFDHYRSEDTMFRTIDTEVAILWLFKPQPSDGRAFKPFVYKLRLDALLERVSDKTIWLKELKTTGGPPQKRLEELRMNRQPIGYVAALRACMQDNERVKGVLGDAIQITAQKNTDIFARDYFPVSENMVAEWRAETIEVVEEWRNRMRRVEAGENPFTVFYKETESCFDYNQKCTFYDLCQFGPLSPMLSAYSPDTWDPFTVEKVVVAEG